MENTMNNINLKSKELDIKVINVETRVIDFGTSCTFISDKHDKQSEELKKAQTEVKQLRNSCKNLVETMKTLKSEKDQIISKMIDLEPRPMRQNLMIYGINES